jgi:uncharacterized protein YbjT (DUF2867 family)
MRATDKADHRILLTGASGYVGGRLLPRLLSNNHPVRCLARRPEHLAHHLDTGIEIVKGDLLDPNSLEAAFEGIETAYYLVHSMGEKRAFESKEQEAAKNFARAAARANLRRIVYLGGLGEQTPELSPHLRSRHEVGHLLRASGVPVIEFRASIVIGSGSLSFEMIRALVETLPIMVTPRWVEVQAQPIAILDLLAYLEQASEADPTGNPIYEIGGADCVSYGDLMREYARQRGLRRWMIPVPVLTPRLSSLWLGLVTPLYARVGRKLIQSIEHPTVVRDEAARRVFPIEPQGVSEAIAAALRNEDREFSETRWSDALSSGGTRPGAYGGARLRGRLIDSRIRHVPVPPDQAFAPIQRIGGENGWYAYDFLWRLRGFLDLLCGGVGIRRGRTHPTRLHIGDRVDWWRVESIQPEQSVRFCAEMKLPGRAWLEYEVTPDGEGSLIRQTAVFDPAGLGGRLYWYGIYPLHAMVFRGMISGIAAAAGRPTGVEDRGLRPASSSTGSSH